MSFQVNPGEVANYVKLIERNSVNLAVVNTHLAQYTNLGSTDGAFLQILVGAHNETVARMRDSIYRGFNAMGNSATELKATADFYANQDQTSAANLDATYPRECGRRSTRRTCGVRRTWRASKARTSRTRATMSRIRSSS